MFGIRGVENVVDDVAAVFGEFGADHGGDEDGVEGVEGPGGVDAWMGSHFGGAILDRLMNRCDGLGWVMYGIYVGWWCRDATWMDVGEIGFRR